MKDKTEYQGKPGCRIEDYAHLERKYKPKREGRHGGKRRGAGGVALHDDQTHWTWVGLWAQGMTCLEIAVRFDCGQSTVDKWIRRMLRRPSDTC